MVFGGYSSHAFLLFPVIFQLFYLKLLSEPGAEVHTRREGILWNHETDEYLVPENSANGMREV